MSAGTSNDVIDMVIKKVNTLDATMNAINLMLIARIEELESAHEEIIIALNTLSKRIDGTTFQIGE